MLDEAIEIMYSMIFERVKKEGMFNPQNGEKNIKIILTVKRKA